MRKVSLKNGSFDHGSIKGHVMRLNDKIGETIGRKFHSYSVFADRLCLSAVGSDGRLEKGEMSPLEVVLFHRDLNQLRVNELTELANTLLDPDTYPMTDGAIESKSVQQDEINYAHGDPRRPYPSRIMDSYPLFGNAEMLQLAKARMLDEWNSPAGKKMVKTIKERRKDARRVMLSGTQKWKGQEVFHFNLNCGRAFYGNEDGLQIRSVQSAIELGMVMLGRELVGKGKQVMMSGILNGMPTPTIDKLRYLDDVGVVSLSSTDIEKVCDCYLSFLKIYHASEASFVDDERIVRFDSNEAKERIELLVNLLEKPLIRV
jgi:hypothetical protein